MTYDSSRSDPTVKKMNVIERFGRFLRIRKRIEDKVELDVYRPGPIEAPFNAHKKRHSLADDNPCSG